MTQQSTGIRMLVPREEIGPDVEVVVANGRTVHMPSPTGQKRIVGFDTDKRENIFALVQEVFGPGKHITLRESEADRLKVLGFVVDPEDYKPLPPPKDEEVKKFGPREAS
jgi:hypothetical protein